MRIMADMRKGFQCCCDAAMDDGGGEDVEEGLDRRYILCAMFEGSGGEEGGS